jgi:WD40 repeat protein
MSISFQCPSCGRGYQVDDGLAGKSVLCKSCKERLTIPSRLAMPDLYGLDDEDDSPADDEAPAPVLGRRHRASLESSDDRTWLWICGGSLAVAALALVVMFALSSSRSDPDPARANPDAPADEVADTEEATSEATTTTVAAPLVPLPAKPVVQSSSWHVKIDPAPANPGLAIPTGVEWSIPIPPAYVGLGESVIFPSSPSPYVCLGGNSSNDQKREVYDLRDGKVVGRLSGRVDIHQPLALSADGRFLTGYAHAQPRATVVWSMADGIQVASIPETTSPARLIDFVGPSQILITTPSWHKLEIWDFLSGQKVHEIATPKGWGWDAEGFALSPGRRYAALVYGADARLRFWDLKTGIQEAELELPKQGSSNPDPEGLAFSPDATLLSALLKIGQDFHLITWDMATGSQAGDLTFTGADALGGYGGHDQQKLQWLPDQSGWLVNNQFLVERQSGQKVWSVPFDELKLKQPASPRRMLDLTHMLLVQTQKSSEHALRLVGLPADQVTAAMTAARGGGSALDALLPPLSAVDLATARAVALPAGDSAWKLKPDGARVGKPLKHKGQPLAAPAHELIGMAWSDPATGQALVLSGPGGPYAAKAKSDQGGMPRHAERLDLAAGRSLAKFDLPAVFDLVALSPDGARALLTTAQGRDRLDVVDAGSGKPVVSWRPGPGPIVWADFQAPDKILSLDAEGVLVLWSLPDAKPLYVLRGAGTTRPALSPGRAVLAAFDGSQVRFVDTVSGDLLGQAPLASAEGPTAAAFRPDGAELAVLAGSNLVRLDLSSQGQATEAASPIRGKIERLQYLGPDHLLLNDHSLYDIARQRLVWQYRNGMTAPSSPDGALWSAASATNIGATTLGAIPVPSPELSQAVSLAFGSDTKALVRDGASVAVRVEGGPPRDADAFRAKVVEALQRQLQAAGITTSADSPVKLVVRFSERDLPGGKIELHVNRPGGGGSEKREMPARAIDWEIALTDPTGPPLVLNGHKGGLARIGFFQIPAGEADYEGIVRLRLFESARDQEVTRVELPYYVARRPKGVVQLPGVTDLGFPQTSFTPFLP